MNHRLSKFWWLWLPLAILFIQLGIEIGCTEQMKEYLLREGGVHENLQAFFAFSACVAALRAFRMVEGKWLKIWFFLGAVGSFFIAGEELSWGQWIFEWTTPAEWAEINDQHETNLHNVSSWLDQKPFIIMSIGVLVGGIIIPILQKYRPATLPQKFKDIYADYRVMPTALIALALKLADTFSDATGIHFFWRVQEILELYIFYFIFVYVLVMIDKHRQQINQELR